MRPRQQWHYAGDGVVRDTPNTPVAWWKPDPDQSTFRVVWADLAITEESGWNPPSSPP